VEHINSFNCVLSLPVIELHSLVVLSELFGDAYVVLSSLATSWEFGKDLRLGGEFVNRSLNTSDDASSPSNATRARRHILRNWSVRIILVV